MKNDVFNKVKTGLNVIHCINLFLIILDIKVLVSNNFNHELTIIPIKLLLIIYPILQLFQLDYLYENKVLLKWSFDIYVLIFVFWIVIYFLILFYLFFAALNDTPMSAL
jgi:hypothetical protein